MLGAWRTYPMQSARAQAPTEDIEKVLGRFQSWTGSRTAKTQMEGVRELSYEEALASSRYRWRGRGEAEPAEAASASEPEAHPDTNPEDKLRAEPGVIPAAGPEFLDSDDAAEVAFAETGMPGVIPPDVPTIGTAAADAHRNETARVRRLPRKPQQFSALLAQSAAFGTGLGAGFGTGGLARTWGGDERQVSMSLRVTASEQALIKMRAAESGVSGSAYLRQCALEVEILRAQVQQMMAASARNLSMGLRDESHAPVGRASREEEGWFSRVRRFWGGAS
jgi:hypothetical protein